MAYTYLLVGCLPLPVIRELHQETMVDFSHLFLHLVFLQLFGILLDQLLQTIRTLIVFQQMIKQWELQLGLLQNIYQRTTAPR